MNTIIVGGGWAGLAAAIELCRHQHSVTIIESARQLGGRARTIQYQGINVDNGQHLLIGAYKNVRHLLTIMGIPEKNVFKRHRLTLLMKSPHQQDVEINTPRLPAPFHLLTGLIGAAGLEWKDKWSMIKFCFSIKHLKLDAGTDIDLLTFLKQQRQPDRVINYLWQPLCLAILNTPLNSASTRNFVRALNDTFSHSAEDSDLLFPRSDLGKVIPEPAQEFIKNNGGKIILGQRARDLRIEDNKVLGVDLSNNEALDADHVILATPAYTCQQLLEPHTAMSEISGSIKKLVYSPICTVYLQFSIDIRLETPMIGLIDTTSQWIFDRSMAGQTGLMAIVISSDGPHMEMTNDELIHHVSNEVATVFPAWPKPESGFVIREKRATFLCHAGVDALRPGFKTPVHGCWLAGDYIATGYPATLEGAVYSGIECAKGIIRQSATTA